MDPEDKEFADNYLVNKNARKSATEAYGINDPVQASSKAAQTLRKDVVREYIKNEAMGAAERITKIAKKSKNLRVKLDANIDILDRAGYKPQDATVNINMPLYLPMEIMEKYSLNKQQDDESQTPMKEATVNPNKF